ncbi:hypothetical protein H261_08738 [Paramagnetospirillum caucaseum]|uniref:Uncharacterized protein n=1 Tax=Paramagnetospirillum caucaseum TaxID=1244869 RepID=M2YBJ4_9PROT|nr:hypothetical protein [Paramagnetospirillum caucaseum]EME70396.1 hypothetical protein H261_08738 [Paramagnetospirillum caucaseum]
MAQRRSIQPTYEEREGEPFATPEDAWIWYSQCQQARDEGARYHAGLGAVARPCAPDDIVLEVRRLYRRRILSGAHLRALVRFGRQNGAAAGEGDATAGRLWREALDRLATPLRAKGIVL